MTTHFFGVQKINLMNQQDKELLSKLTSYDTKLYNYAKQRAEEIRDESLDGQYEYIPIKKAHNWFNTIKKKKKIYIIT